MGATIPGGAVTHSGKRLVGLSLPAEVVEKIQTAIQQTGITRQAFILLAIHEKLKRDLRH